MDHPLIRAYRARDVCVANSFRTKALNKKAALAVLTDPRHGDLFSDEQRARDRGARALDAAGTSRRWPTT